MFLFRFAVGVDAVAERFAATPFDVEGVFWSHRGETCTFDVMVEEFDCDRAMLRLAAIVRGADTGASTRRRRRRGLLRGLARLSRMAADDLAQLEAGMTL